MEQMRREMLVGDAILGVIGLWVIFSMITGDFGGAADGSKSSLNVARGPGAQASRPSGIGQTGVVPVPDFRTGGMVPVAGAP